jgi:CDP-paratose 2-epimerase
VKVIITGGAGFIGSNAAARHLARGHDVVVLDDLSRRGAEKNLAWLREGAPRDAGGAGGSGAGIRAPGAPAPTGRLTVGRVDLRSAAGVAQLFEEHADAAVVLHLGGQVAVTTSVVDPRADFEINALGTFNVLEAARTLPRLQALLFASTNKVYGAMEDVGIVERQGRYAYAALADGVAESQQLDFHSPYGCSKGAADQYTIDYARIYDLPTVVLRQSCIYGPRQLGVEDQGWVAWFCIAATLGKPLSIYGDGMQVRDVLWIEDLLDAYDQAVARIDHVRGQAFNVGGGTANTLSLLELLTHLERRLGHPLRPSFEAWRPGDQRVFVADISRAGQELGWAPRVDPAQGVDRLLDWVAANRRLFVELYG